MIHPSSRVIGIDPGLTRMGFGVVERSAGILACLDSGTLSTSPGPAPARLKQLFAGISTLIADWSPEALAIEKVFLKLNLKTGVPAIQAWGIALLAGALAEVRVAEYSPAEVKKAITGVGTAAKDQVEFMVGKLLAGKVTPDSADAADALAVAVTYLHSQPVVQGRYAGAEATL